MATKNFNIRLYSVYDEELKENVFLEYRGVHIIYISIDNDSSLINKVLEMDINNAKRNVGIISKNLDVELANIQGIKCNFEENFITRRRY